MSLTALIPARSGSKGIKNKNIKIFDGKPLIVWAIEAAKYSKSVDRVIVSTDSQTISDLSLKAGAEVPSLRPPHLATDSAKTIDVVLDFLNKNQNINDILLLQPTSPLRKSEDIDNIFKLRKKANVESAVSIVASQKCPEWMFRLSDDKLVPILKNFNDEPRQEIMSSYFLNGALYLASRNFITRNNSLISSETIGYIMPSQRSVDIDTQEDWDLALFYKKKIS